MLDSCCPQSHAKARPKALLFLLLLIMMAASIRGFSLRHGPSGRMPRLVRQFAGRTNAVSVSNTERMRHEAVAEMQRVTEYYQSQALLMPNKPVPRLLQTAADVSAFLAENGIDTVLFDCDGVLYRSPDAIPGARECIQSLLSSQKKIFFVTNNSASNRQQLRDKLTRTLQLDDDNLLTPDMMVGSAYACAQYLRRELPHGSSVFVIGESGLCQELRDAGFAIVTAGGGDDQSPSMSREELAHHDFTPVAAVVVGHDPAFNFRKLCLATVLLQRNPDALLAATNMDAFDLVGADGRHIPGNGALVRSIEYASGRTAVNVGKPSTTLMDLMVAESMINVDASRTLMVGDRLDTDIRFGVENGMASALVLTGVTGLRELMHVAGTSAEQPLPTVILSHVGLFSLME